MSSAKSIADLRREFASHALTEAEADPDPMRQFERWFGEAERAELLDVTAMTLATATPDGEPSARTVLLKGLDDRGFVFFTNYGSAKARDLDGNPRAALLFFWAELERQVRITGGVSRVSSQESSAYFHSRPLDSQLGAWASAQSQELPDRRVLEARVEELRAEYAGQVVPLPPFWGGYVVVPERIEFWQGRVSRLHDRLLYTREANGAWSRVRLSP